MRQPRIFASLLLSCAWTAVSNGEESFIHDRVSIVFTGVEVSEGVGSLVKINLSSPSSFHVFFIPNPDRLVIDAEGFPIGSGKRFMLSDNSFVKRVRIGAHESKMTRIVLDLSAPCDEQLDSIVSKKDSTLGIGFSRGSMKNGTSTAPVRCKVTEGESVPVTTSPNSAVPTVASPVAPIPVTPRTGVTPAKIPPPKAPDLTLPTAGPQPAAPQPASPTPKPVEATDVVSPDIEASNLAIETSIVHFGPNSRPVRDVTVRNFSAHPLLVESTITEIEDPATERSIESRPNALLVSPKQMKLQPQETRNIRILLAEKAGERERYFQVKLTSKPGPASHEETAAVDEKSADIGISLLAVAPPKDPTEKISGALQDNRFIILNSGNTSVLLEDGEICPRIEGTPCSKLPGRWLVAGGNWPVDVGDAGSIRFLKKNGSVIQPLIFSIE